MVKVINLIKLSVFLISFVYIYKSMVHSASKFLKQTFVLVIFYFLFFGLRFLEIW